MPDEDLQRTRRAILLGAAAGVAVLAADTLARPLDAKAADGDALILGQDNASGKPTFLKSGNLDRVLVVEGVGTDGVFAHSDSKAGLLAESEEGNAIEAHTAASTGFGVKATSDHFVGVYGEGGQSGVHGDSDSGDGVRGISRAGIGVAADSNSGWGMLATSVAGSGIGAVSVLRSGVVGTSDAVVVDARELVDVAGVYGRSTEPGPGKPGQGPLGNGLGVLGRSGTGVGVRGESDGVGVEGRTNGVEGVGVLGGSPNTGVHGSGDRVGVEGKSLPGVGVSGNTQDGYAVAANVFPGGSGFAIIAHGPVIFDSAGRGNLVGGRARVTPGVALDGTSKVLVTLMGNPGAKTLVPYVEVSAGPAGTGFFSVQVPGAKATAVPFAFFVIS